MKSKKPYYDVNFWEYVYEREQKLYNDLLLQKANRLKWLKDKDLFLLPEDKAMQTQKTINALTSELNTLHGFKLFTDEMRNCYMENIEKTCGGSFERILQLERELFLLEEENNSLLEHCNRCPLKSFLQNPLLLNQMNKNQKNERRY